MSKRDPCVTNDLLACVEVQEWPQDGRVEIYSAGHYDESRGIGDKWAAATRGEAELGLPDYSVYVAARVGGAMARLEVFKERTGRVGERGGWTYALSCVSMRTHRVPDSGAPWEDSASSWQQTFAHRARDWGPEAGFADMETAVAKGRDALFACLSKGAEVRRSRGFYRQLRKRKPWFWWTKRSRWG